MKTLRKKSSLKKMTRGMDEKGRQSTVEQRIEVVGDQCLD